MLYTVKLNKDNYILSVAHTNNDDVELNLDVMDKEYLDCYRLIDGVAVLDVNKRANEKAEREAASKIPTDLEVLEAQCLYTAMMTDTLLGGEE